MLSLFAQLSILLTGETGGVSGRQVDPVLPTLTDARVQKAGYHTVTHRGRACFPKNLADFARFLETGSSRTLGDSATMLRWRHSWFVVDKPSPELLHRLGATEAAQQSARWERWSDGEVTLRCITLGTDEDEPTLASNLGDWEIRWSASAEMGGTGNVIEIARPLGDGSRRLQQIQQGREQRPDLLWFDLGGLLEGRSLIRDGLDLHRRLTVQALQSVPPNLLLPGDNDLAGGLDHLLGELRTAGTQLLDTAAPSAKPGLVRQWRHTQDGQELLVLGLTSTSSHAANRAAVEKLLREARGDEWVILLARQAVDLRPWLQDPRIAIIAVPGPVRFGPFQGTWQRGQAKSGGPLLLQIAPNRLMTVSLQSKGRLEFTSTEVDERVPAHPKLARQVNRIRHTLYPDLNRILIPEIPKSAAPTPQTKQTETMLAYTILRAADADAVLLPPLAGDRALGGGLTRMELRAQLRIPGSLVRRRVEGRDLLKVAATESGVRLFSREKLTAEAPLLLVTTEAIANRLAKTLGTNASVHPLRQEGERLVPLKPGSGGRPTSVRDLSVSLIEGQLLWDSPNSETLQKRVLSMLTMPEPRSAFRFRIDRLSLSIQEVSLRAPVARRAPEDPRANSPTRLSVGSQFDLRMEQPWRHLVASLRGVGEYRRESFPGEQGQEAVDKEAVDDLKGIVEVAARSGNYRPFVNLGLDSEFTAGTPGASSPGPRQALVTFDTGLILPKRGLLHEARLSAVALRDYTEQLSTAEPEDPSQWRFGVSGLADFRRTLPVGSLRLLLGARLFLPETAPQPNTLLWAFSERVEYAFPLAGGLNLKAYFEHLSWRTHLADPAPQFADTWVSGGLSLDFARVLRPFAGLF